MLKKTKGAQAIDDAVKSAMKSLGEGGDSEKVLRSLIGIPEKGIATKSSARGRAAREVEIAQQGLETAEKGGKESKVLKATEKLRVAEQRAADVEKAVQRVETVNTHAEQVKTAKANKTAAGLKSGSGGMVNVVNQTEVTKTQKTLKMAEISLKSAEDALANVMKTGGGGTEGLGKVGKAGKEVRAAKEAVEAAKIAADEAKAGKATAVLGASAGEKFMDAGRSPLLKGVKEAFKMGNWTKSVSDFGKTVQMASNVDAFALTKGQKAANTALKGVGQAEGGMDLLKTAVTRGQKATDAAAAAGDASRYAGGADEIGGVAKVVAKKATTEARKAATVAARRTASMPGGATSAIVETSKAAQATDTATTATKVATELAATGQDAVRVSSTGLKVSEALAKLGKPGAVAAESLVKASQVAAKGMQVIGGVGKVIAAPGVGLAMGAGIGMMEKGMAKDYDRQLQTMDLDAAAGYGFATGGASTGGVMAQDLFGMRKDAGNIGEWNASDMMGMFGAGVYGGIEGGIIGAKAGAGNPWAIGGGAAAGAAGSMYFEHQKVKERHAEQKRMEKHDPAVLAQERVAEFMDEQAELQGGDFRAGLFGTGNRQKRAAEMKQQSIDLYTKSGMSQEEAEAKFNEQTRPAALNKIAQMEADKDDWARGNMAEKTTGAKMTFGILGGEESIAGDSQQAKEAIAELDRKIAALKKSNNLTEEDNKIIEQIKNRDQAMLQQREMMTGAVGAKTEADWETMGRQDKDLYDEQGNRNTFSSIGWSGGAGEGLVDKFYKKKRAQLTAENVASDQRAFGRAGAQGGQTRSMGMGLMQASMRNIGGQNVSLDGGEFGRNISGFAQSGEFRGNLDQYKILERQRKDAGLDKGEMRQTSDSSKKVLTSWAKGYFVGTSAG